MAVRVSLRQAGKAPVRAAPHRRILGQAAPQEATELKRHGGAVLRRAGAVITHPGVAPGGGCDGRLQRLMQYPPCRRPCPPRRCVKQRLAQSQGAVLLELRRQGVEGANAEQQR